MASSGTVTDNYLEIGSIKYFRGKAENVELCSYGEKRIQLAPRPTWRFRRMSSVITSPARLRASRL